MADREFEEFKIAFEMLPQHIKAPLHCYTIAHDIDALSAPPTPMTEIQKSLPSNECSKEVKSDESTVSLKNDPFVPTVTTEKKRRKLPAIPIDKKSSFKMNRGASLADEILDAMHQSSSKDSSDDSCSIPINRHRSKDFDRGLFLDLHGSGSCDVDSGVSTTHSPDGPKSLSPVGNGSLSHSSSTTISSVSSSSRFQVQDATHRGLHKFVPRHIDEIEIEIGDPIYVQNEAEDGWCEGLNLRTGSLGIFPGAYVTDVNYSEFDPDGIKSRKQRYLVDFLGSIEVAYHKGNDILCQAVKKVASARNRDLGTRGPHSCLLEICDQGIRMVDRKNPEANHVPMHDYFFNLKNVTFCGYHPKDTRYFGFVTKHPLQQRFACHVFMGEDSTRGVAEAVGHAFQRFYQKFIETAYPVEEIFLE